MPLAMRGDWRGMQKPAADAHEWRILGPEGLSWHCWDGEYVVYHPFSGMTHYLDAVAGEVFARLLERPATAGDLAIALAELACIDRDQAAAAVQQTLARLDLVGLAEAIL